LGAGRFYMETPNHLPWKSLCIYPTQNM
jgi:hypothetical protein